MTADEVDVVRDLYDALGVVVRELGIAHDTLNSVTAGVAIEHLAGAVLDAAARVDRVYAVAAELRRRYG